MIGQKFGRLIVIKECGRTRHQKILWQCLCECGEYTNVTTGALNSGHTKSCGCYHRERASIANLKHGFARVGKKHPLYFVWRTMKNRCTNPTVGSKYYLDKGIRVCPEWSSSFESFKDWALASGYKEGLAIDRIDNDGYYEPSNCQWLTRAENCRKAVIERERDKCLGKSARK